MVRASLSGGVVLSAVLGVLAGCSETPSTADAGTRCTDAAACVCKKALDCPADHKYLCITSQCIRKCSAKADCDPGDVCEDMVCMKPGCAADAECGAGSQCAGGDCKPKVVGADVKSCLVQPERALLHQGATKTFSVIARDGSGAAIAYKGDVDWTADPAARATFKDKAVVQTVTGGTEAGAVPIKAKIGSIDCTASSATNFAAPDTGKVRVVVADMLTKQPVTGATVMIGATAATDAGGGVYIADGDASPKDISVFTSDTATPRHAWVTTLGVTSRDVAIFLKRAVSGKVGFAGSVTPRYFDRLQILGENVHLALFGSSIAGNLIDVSLTTLIGDLVKTEIDYGSGKQEVPLPSGVVLGIGNQMFKPGPGISNFAVYSTPGLRTLWGLGGNANLGDLVGALTPVISGGTKDLNIGALLNTLLPLLGKMESGALTGQLVPDTQPSCTATQGCAAGSTCVLPPPEDGSTDVPPGTCLKDVTVNLTTPLRIKADATIPELPTYQKGTGIGRFDGAVVLGGALFPPQGLVPTGVTAGVDVLDKKTEQPDGFVDPPDVNGTKGHVTLALAPLHSGLESSRYVAMAIALSFGSFGGSDSSTDENPLVLSGSIDLPTGLKYTSTGDYPKIVFPSFMKIPDAPSVAGRTFQLGGTIDGAAMHRLDIGDEENGEWLVYFGAGSASVQIPTPPTGFADRLNGETDGKLRKILVQSMGFAPGQTGEQAAANYEDAVSFNGENLDDLTARINRFSLRELDRN